MNLCTLNKIICLGPPVWLDYVKTIGSQEDRPNCQSCPHTLVTVVNAASTEGGYNLQDWRACNHVHVACSHIPSCFTEKEKRHYLLAGKAETTCGGGEGGGSPVMPSRDRASGSQRTKVGSICIIQWTKDYYPEHTQFLKLKKKQPNYHKGEIHKKYKRLIYMLNFPKAIPLFI